MTMNLLLTGGARSAVRTCLAALLSAVLLAGVAASLGGCSRRHIYKHHGREVKEAFSRQIVHKRKFIAERPDGLEPGDTNIVLDNFYSSLKSKKPAAQSQPVGIVLEGK
jgi:hypothetical protein